MPVCGSKWISRFAEGQYTTRRLGPVEILEAMWCWLMGPWATQHGNGDSEVLCRGGQLRKYQLRHHKHYHLCAMIIPWLLFHMISIWVYIAFGMYWLETMNSKILNNGRLQVRCCHLSWVTSGPLWCWSLSALLRCTYRAIHNHLDGLADC